MRGGGRGSLWIFKGKIICERDSNSSVFVEIRKFIETFTAFSSIHRSFHSLSHTHTIYSFLSNNSAIFSFHIYFFHSFIYSFLSFDLSRVGRRIFIRHGQVRLRTTPKDRKYNQRFSIIYNTLFERSIARQFSRINIEIHHSRVFISPKPELIEIIN